MLKACFHSDSVLSDIAGQNNIADHIFTSIQDENHQTVTVTEILYLGGKGSMLGQIACGNKKSKRLRNYLCRNTALLEPARRICSAKLCTARKELGN